MHREIDAAGGEGFFNLLGEHSLGSDLGQCDVGNLVAGGVDDFNFDFMPPPAQQRGNVIGLPKSKLRAAGTDAKLRQGRRPSARYRTKAKGGRLGRLEQLILHRA